MTWGDVVDQLERWVVELAEMTDDLRLLSARLDLLDERLDQLD